MLWKTWQNAQAVVGIKKYFTRSKTTTVSSAMFLNYLILRCQNRMDLYDMACFNVSEHIETI